MTIKFKKLHENAKLPTFGHDGDAGLDLYLVEDTEIGAYADAWLPTGIAWEPEKVPSIEKPYSGLVTCIEKMHGWKAALLVRPRSSMAKRSLDITEGTIDRDYRGEIKIHVRNMGPLRADLKAGDRIAQAVPVMLPEVDIEEADTLSDTDRGANGFGSTGR